MEKLESFNPRTGDLVGSVAITEPADVAEVVARSREAFSRWSVLSHAERRPYLVSFKRTLLRNTDRVAELLHEEAGKDLADAYTSDIMPTLNATDYYARKAERLLRPRRASTWPYLMTRGWTEYHPRGVVAVIPAYNAPLFLATLSMVPALAAGCAAIIKPSELTPLTGELIADLVEEAGFPADLVQVIQGGAETGRALVKSGVDLIVFTGSPGTGRKVAAEAAARLTPTILELGGKDAMVVLEDADVRHAAEGAVWGSTFNAGQMCISVERVYVPEAIYGHFLTELDLALDSVAAGTGDARDVGAMIDSRQVDIIEDQIADAVSRGATIRRGGRRLTSSSGCFFEPTLLTDVDHSMRIMQEETFGPVVAVMRVPDEETALRLANDSSYGLHGSVWSRDKRRAARWASRIHTGTVAVNDHMINPFIPGLGFGGVKSSGYGIELGPDGIRSFCYAQSISSPRWTSTSRFLLGFRWNPRRLGPRYWRNFARLFYRW
jgi:acyl-CoA reductase-like NAD-dependent aldehyde dehydrogenase